MTETERTVARGAAAPPAERPANGHTAVTARPRRADALRRSSPPAERDRTRAKPRTTLPAGRPATAPAAAAAACSRAAAAGRAAGARRRRRGGRRPRRRRRRRDARRRARRSTSARSRRSSQDFAAAYGDEDGAALGRLLTRDVERVVPGARQQGRAAVLKAYRRQFEDSDTRSFELRDLEATGGARPAVRSARFVATYGGEPDVTGAIVFNVLRDRGTPRIALISARQDPPPSSSAVARDAQRHLAARQHLRRRRAGCSSQTFGSPGRSGSRNPPASSVRAVRPSPSSCSCGGVGVAADEVGHRHAHLAHDPRRRRSPGAGRARRRRRRSGSLRARAPPRC